MVKYHMPLISEISQNILKFNFDFKKLQFNGNFVSLERPIVLKPSILWSGIKAILKLIFWINLVTL